MRTLIKLNNKGASIISSGSAAGLAESKGPFGSLFDLTSRDDRFGQKTWEAAEAEMGRIALSSAIKRSGRERENIEALFAGDLENQCVASSSGLYTFGIPYIGLYSACSTCTEAILLLSTLIDSGNLSLGAVVTTSHNSAAERQFRTPIEYGSQRTPTAQWTATAAGAFVIGRDGGVKIKEALIGKIVDGQTKDASNMGAAMARAAFDTVYTFFSLSDISPAECDLVVTGDLGAVGSSILEELIEKEIPALKGKLCDCGNLIYGSSCDVHSGGSGCGCSASMLAAYFFPSLSSGRYKRILFLSTGALMSPGSVLQGENILGIAPAILLEGNNFERKTDTI